MIDTFEKNARVATQANPAPEAEQAWHWCPTCKLASSRGGECPGCSRALVVAPEVGVPDAPYTPKVRADRSGWSTLASVASMLALALGIAFGIYMLATHGSTSVDSGAAVADGGTVDGRSAFAVAALHGTLRLQGTWGATMAQEQLSPQVTGGAQVKNELSVAKGTETISISSFLSSDPSGVLNQFVTTSPQTQADATGDKTTTEPSRDVSIAGYTAVAQDQEVRNAKGGMLHRVTVYAVSAGSRVVMIRVEVAPSQADDLAAIEQALVNIG